jgi:hypothetical protein
MQTHILIAQIQEFLKLDTTVRECAECSLLLELGSHLRVGYVGVSLSKIAQSISPPSVRDFSAEKRTMVGRRGGGGERGLLNLRGLGGV